MNCLKSAAKCQWNNDKKLNRAYMNNKFAATYDQETKAKLEREYQLKKLLAGKSEEQQKIQAAKKRWKMLRKKKRLIVQMNNLSQKNMNQIIKYQKDDHKKVVDEEGNWYSKLIIPPNNYWNLQWNNLTVLIFLLYMFILPIKVCFEQYMIPEDISNLLIFDIIFIMDRLADLFVASYTVDGKIETRLLEVIKKNYDYKFLLEVIVSIGPLFFDTNHLNSLVYAAFKIPRYARLFEIDSQIQEIMEYYGDSWSLYERKSIEPKFDTFKFFTSTSINLHFLTCMMIVICHHRQDWENSWLGNRGLDKKNQKSDQYINALYFVTTTVSTCGFGDISAMKGDPNESAVVLVLQFVGMLFYSMTIQNVSSIVMGNDDQVTSPMFALFRVEDVENLIVKVERQLPPERKIPGKVIQ